MKDVLEEHKTHPLPTDPWARAAPLPRSIPMNEYGYPLIVVQRRQRMWATRPISATLTSLASTLLGMAHPTYAADSAVTREFEQFARTNVGFGPLDLLLFLFATDLLLQGLKASTVDTYVSGILRCRTHANQKITGPFVSDVKKILEEIQCHEDVHHARDIDDAIAMLFLALLDGAAQAVCFLMIVCGARVSDLMGMTRAQFKFLPSREVQVSFKLTKNHRKKGAQYSIVVPIPHGVPLSLAAHFAPGDPSAPLISLATDDFNAALKLVGERFSNLAGVTSYSFRRLFIQRNIARFTDPASHLTDWAEVVKLSGHLKIETVRTCYTREGQDTL